jgi:hypothetical protein
MRLVILPNLIIRLNKKIYKYQILLTIERKIHITNTQFKSLEQLYEQKYTIHLNN